MKYLIRFVAIAVCFFTTVSLTAQTWNLTTSPVLGSNYPISVTTDGASHGSSIVIFSQAPGSSTWNSCGGGGGAPGNSSITASGTAGFTVAGLWTFKLVNGGADTSPTLSTTTRTVSPISTTFTFSNLSFTYDGSVKTATVTPTPANATYTTDLTKGPAVGSYTVSASAYGSFSGSGSATLTIAAPANTVPTAAMTIKGASSGTVSGVVGETLSISISGADADANLRAVNLWVNTPATGYWRNIRSDNTLNGGFVENNTADNAISSGGANVASLGAATRTFTIPLSEGFGTYQFVTRSIDAAGAASVSQQVNVQVDNRAPSGTYTINGVNASASVYFGQSVAIASTVNDPDGNLTVHSFFWDQGSVLTWTHPIITWNYPPDQTGWSNLNIGTNGYNVSNGSTSTKSFTFTGNRAATFQFHCAASDNIAWVGVDSNIVLNVVVNPTPPSYTGGGNITRTAVANNTYTVVAGDLNVALYNQYSGTVAPPTGNVTYSVVGPGTAVTAGTVLTPGTYTIRASYAGDSNYTSRTLDSIWTINPTIPVITSGSMPVGQVGVPYSYQITAIPTPSSYGATGLPPGLNVSVTTGLISGTPTTAGAYNSTVGVTNVSGTTTAGFAVTIIPANTAPTITSVANQTTTTAVAVGPLPFTVSDTQTAASSLTVSGASSNTTLVPAASIIFGGSGASRTATVTPSAGQTGTASITLTVSDGSLTSSTTFTLTVSAPNTAPTITSVANQTTTTAVAVGPLAFTVSDTQTAAGSLTVSGASSNPTLVPAANIALGGSGANRTVTVTPATGQTGTASITLTVSDGSLTSSTAFTLTVSAPNTAPTITSVANQTTTIAVAVGPLAFTVGDLETAVASLTVTKASSNTTLLPTANIALGGSGANRTVTVTPATGQTGTASITLTVSDGSLTSSTAFTLTVSAPNTAPTITSVANQYANTGTVVGPLAFTVGDAETAGASLTVTRASSNTTLLPLANVVLGGSGASRTVTVTPASGQNGTATITLSVSDGSLTTSSAFTLTVAANSAPIITSPSSFVYGNSYVATATGGNGTGALFWTLVSNTASGAAINSGTGVVTANSVGTIVINVYRSADATNAQSPTSASFTINVTTRPITVTLSGSKNYDGTTALTGATAAITSGSLAGADTISYAFNNAPNANAGNYSVTASGIAFRSSAHSGSSSGSLVLNKPAGTAVNDVLLACISADMSPPGNFTSPVGWTSLGTQGNGFDGQISECFIHVVDGTEGSTFNFNYGYNDAVGLILCYSGVNTTTPLDVTPTQSSSDVAISSGGLVSAPSITPIVNGAMLVWLAGLDSGGGASAAVFTVPAGYTLRETSDFGWSDEAAADLVLSTAEATGTVSGSVAFPDTAGTFGYMVALAPAAGTNLMSATVSNPASYSITYAGSYTINSASTPVITSALNASGQVGTGFSYQITASNTPTSFSASGLPAGLTLNTSSGVISGAPTTAATSYVTINAINASGTSSATLTLTVNAENVLSLVGVYGASQGGVSPFSTATITNVAPAGTNRLLMVSSVSWSSAGPAISTVTFGGEALTKLTGGAWGGTGDFEVWYLVNPSTTAASVVVSYSSAPTESSVIASTYSGAAQAAPFGALATAYNGATSSATVSRSSSASDLLVFFSATDDWGMVTSGSAELTRVLEKFTAGYDRHALFIATDGTTGGTLTGGNNPAISPGDTSAVAVAIHSASTPTITSPLNASGQVGTPFSYQITADNSPTSFSATSLPAGLTVNTSTGVISGTPTTAATSSVAISATNAGGTGTATLTLTVSAANTAPTISSIANQSTTPGVAKGPLAFTVGDAETAASSLTVTRASSNTTLLPTANVVLGGSGANRTVVVTPAAGQTGTTTITLTVSDGSLSATTTFTVTVAAAAQTPQVILNSYGVHGPWSGPYSNATIPNVIPSGINRLLIVTLNLWEGSGAASVSFGGVSLSRHSTGVWAGTGKLETWYLVNPSTTSGDVIITFNAPVGEYAAQAFTLSGVDQTTPLGTPAGVYDNNTSITLSPASSDADLVLFNVVTESDSVPSASGITFVREEVNDSGSESNTLFSVAGSAGSTSAIITQSEGLAGVGFAVHPVAAPGIPVITSALNASGQVGTPFSYQITASNSPTSFSATGLPGGLIVNTSTGAISGTPTTAATSSVTIGATNASGTDAATLTLTVSAANTAPTISSVADQTTTTGVPMGPLNFTVGDAEMAAGSLTLTKASSNTTLLPTANIALGGSGANRTVTVTPAAGQTGASTITLTVSDGSLTTSTTFVLTVNGAAPGVTSVATANGQTGTVFNYQIQATNSPTSYSTTTLPPGLTLNTTTGMISGTPTKPGIYSITVSATNAGGTGTLDVTVTILPTLPYTADFETSEGYTAGTLNEQLGWVVSSGSASVTTADHSSGAGSVSLAASNPVTVITQSFASTPTASIEYFDFFAKPIGQSVLSSAGTFRVAGARFGLQLNGAQGQLSVLNGNGSGGGTWSATPVSFPLDANDQTSTWVRFTVRLDFTNQKWDLYANGTMVAADVGFGSNFTFLSTFQAQGDLTKASGIDYIFAGPTNPVFGDTNNNGIDDTWETAHGLSLSANNRNTSPTGNGITVIQAYVAGTNPTDFFNSSVPTLITLGGDNQTGQAGQFNELPFDMGVWNAAGTAPLVNAPVTFTVQTGGGGLSLANTGAVSSTVGLTTDSNGTATVYYKQPATPGAQSTILFTAGTAQAFFFTTAFIELNAGNLTDLTDSDNDGLPDAWEMLHFHNLTSATGAMDSDGDGISNAAEYRAGTDPMLNEKTGILANGFQVYVRLPTGQYNGVKDDWSVSPVTTP